MEHNVKRKIIDENVLLKVQSGSHLYGLSTPNSDVDYLGVVVEPFKYKVGFQTFGELDVSVVDKLDNGRNSKEAIDEKYYSLTKFVELLFKNNPTIVELLFARNAETRSPIIEKLYEHRMDFLSYPKIENGFIGYAISQEKKMEIKSDNLDQVSNFYDLIKDIPVDGTTHVIDVLAREDSLKDIHAKYKTDQMKIAEQVKVSQSKDELKSLNNKFGKMFLGTREFSVNILFKKFKTQLEQIMNQKSHRSESVKKHGFCTKFASHYLRLLLEGEELLLTGDLKFPLKDRDFLLDVKLGKYTMNEVLQKGKELKDRIRLASKNAVISKTTNICCVEDMVLDFYKETYGITK